MRPFHRNQANIASVAILGALALVFAGMALRGPSDFRVQALALAFGAALAYAYAAVLFEVMIVVALLLIALIPIYWVPPPGGGLPFTLTPATVAALVLAPVAVKQIGLGRLVITDVLVAALLVTGTATNYFNMDYPFNFSISLCIRVGLLYLAFRIIARRMNLLQAVTVTTFTVGSVLGIAALFERLTRTNIFLELRTPGYQSEIWAKLFIRFGEVRAAASFGQPIPMGLFFAVCVILGAGLWVSTSHRGWRIAILFGEALLVAGLWSTLTRAPLAVAFGGYLLFVVRSSRVRRVQQLLFVTLAGVAALVVTPIGTQVANLLENTFGASTDKLTASSTEYRGSLFEAFGYTQNYTSFGLARHNLFDQTGAVGVSGSVDNEYLLRLLQYGSIGLALFIGVVLVTIYVAVTETHPLRSAWAISTAGVSIAIMTVALLLQQGDYFWIGVAITAAGLAERSEDEERPNQRYERKANRLAPWQRSAGQERVPYQRR